MTLVVARLLRLPVVSVPLCSLDAERQAFGWLYNCSCRCLSEMYAARQAKVSIHKATQTVRTHDPSKHLPSTEVSLRRFALDASCIKREKKIECVSPHGSVTPHEVYEGTLLRICHGPRARNVLMTMMTTAMAHRVSASGCAPNISVRWAMMQSFRAKSA